jgi:dihydrofolate synthase/folylpolyglutamate synthase
MVHMPHWPVPLWHHTRYDLANLSRLLLCLGSPHLKVPPVIHVAGTNGKGSTIAYLSAIFKAAGYKVHSYTSPHLIHFNERIVLGNEKISDSYLWDICERTRLAAQHNQIDVRFFEGITAAAMLAFSETPADILLLETGMGGRLDATNIIPRPILTIITEISYDHMEYLGSTLEVIAMEKAGIIKPGIPCVISSQVDEVYRQLFIKCEAMRAEITAFSYDFGVKKENDGFYVLGLNHDDVKFSLPSLLGDHQIINAATVIAGVSKINNQYNISLEHIESALRKTFWPARLQKIITKYGTVWLDGAHNSSGAFVLSAWARQELGNDVSLILGMTKNRNVVDFITPFKGIVNHVFCTQVLSEPSSYTSSKLTDLVREANFVSIDAESLENALRLAAAYPAPVIVTGSLFLAADLLKLNGNTAT